MIVPSPIARRLATGHITQLRLPIGRDQRLNDGRTVPAACPYKVGRDYPIQPVTVTELQCDGRTYTHREKAPALEQRLEILEVHRGRLLDLTYRDARREGYPQPTWQDDILATWKAHYPSVKVNADTPVWILQVRVQHDRALFLAPTGSMQTTTRREGDEQSFTGAEHDYTTSLSMAVDDGEVVNVGAKWEHRGALTHAEARPHDMNRRLARALRSAA